MSDLISRQAVLDIWHTSYSDIRVENEEIQYKKIAYELPSADILDHARAIKKHCENCSGCEKCKFSREAIHLNGTVWHKCRLREGGCPNMWDLPEGEKGGAE